jgi:hypothetical protein
MDFQGSVLVVRKSSAQEAGQIQNWRMGGKAVATKMESGPSALPKMFFFVGLLCQALSMTL